MHKKLIIFLYGQYIFIVREMQEKFRAKGKKLYFGFVDFEKTFDRVPREVIRWAMRKLGVEGWLVPAVMSMYIGAKNRLRSQSSKLLQHQTSVF